MAGDSARDIARRQREKAARLERSAQMWERGAQGEAATATALNELRGRGWTIFHDVRWPGRQRANIDHIAVGPAGVFVIDSKNWSGDVRVVDSVLHQGTRRREREVAAAAEAALAVTQLLQGLPATPVLCFVRPEPVEGWARDVMVCSTQNLAATIAAQPPVLGAESIRRVTAILQWQLTSASQPKTARSTPGTRPTATPRRPGVVRKVMLRSTMAVAGLMVLLIVLAIALGIIGAVVNAFEASARHGGDGGVGALPTSPPTLGEAVRLPATPSHPALRLQADTLMRVATTQPGYALQQGEHLVGVRYTIRNEGTQLWGATSPYLTFSALMSNGQHAAAGSYSALPASKMFPAAFNLRPGRARRGVVVYAVPNGAKLVRVSVQVNFGGSDTVEWLIP